MELNIKTFDKICRVCLTESNKIKSLFTKLDGDERNLLEILSFTANVDIKIEDSLPKHVCSDCESIMCKADAFKRRCHESESILRNVYSNAAVSSETEKFIINCSIKHENSDVNQELREYGTLVASTQVNNEEKESFNTQNVLPDFGMSTTNDGFNRFPKEQESIKEEAAADFEDRDDNVGDYEEAQIEILLLKDKTNVKKSQNKNGTRFECYCKSYFACKEKYETHLKEKRCDVLNLVGEVSKVSAKNPAQCTKCDKQFTTPQSWRTHQRYHKDEALYQCSRCLRKFHSKNTLSSHIRRHEARDKIIHVCDICKREFKYKAFLEKHLLTAHSRGNEIICEICAQSFSDTTSLEIHKKSHDDDKKHRCTECSKAFSTLPVLKEHMRTHTGEKPYLCAQCGRGFSQKTNLAQHMRRHQGVKPFKCENCEKRFVSKGELEAHNRKHSGAHPFVCDVCGNGLTTSSALLKHRRIHTGEKPYQCDLCPRRFAASGTLKNHRRTHTGERPFQCSYCEKAFVQRNDLISHIRCHTGERPYTCNQCGQSFRKASGLKTHVKMHIKDPIVGVNAILMGMHCAEQ